MLPMMHAWFQMQQVLLMAILLRMLVVPFVQQHEQKETVFSQRTSYVLQWGYSSWLQHNGLQELQETPKKL
jgi:hypothetical protein